VYQVDYLPELYEDARSKKYKTMHISIYTANSFRNVEFCLLYIHKLCMIHEPCIIPIYLLTLLTNIQKCIKFSFDKQWTQFIHVILRNTEILSFILAGVMTSLNVNQSHTCNFLIIPRICEMCYTCTEVHLSSFLLRQVEHISRKGIRDMGMGMPRMSYLWSRSELDSTVRHHSSGGLVPTFVCKCVRYYCHRVSTKLQLNII